jgi:hypothetical protein
MVRDPEEHVVKIEKEYCKENYRWFAMLAILSMISDINEN